MKAKKITTANSTNIPTRSYKTIYPFYGSILSCSFDELRDGLHSLFKPPD
ncbi:MAG: hypothetical protein ABWY16_18595 [Pedobacter sp.]